MEDELLFYLDEDFKKEYKKELETFKSFDFTRDLIIAIPFGDGAIKETCNRVWKTYKNDYEILTKFIINLNHLCWSLYSKADKENSEKFSNLYYEYQDKFYNDFEDNKKATKFYCIVTD